MDVVKIFFVILHISEGEWQQIFKVVWNDPTVCQDWEGLAHQLGLSSNEVEQIEAANNIKRDRCRAALEKWRGTSGNNASKRALCRHLQARGQHTVARMLMIIIILLLLLEFY